MFEVIHKILKEKNILFHLNEGITIANVQSLHEGFTLTKEILYALADRKSVLYLSGGSTPKVLYEELTKEEKLLPGAVGMIDERFGDKFHERSNERMIQETGLLRYFQMRDVPFYPILQGKTREKTAEWYDEKFRSLNATYQKNIAILGIGADGHTAGIAGNRKDFQNPLFDQERKHLLVSEFDDATGTFKERVTMTFLGLSMLDYLVVLALGPEKQESIKFMFDEGVEEEIPARFFKRPDVAGKTILITDQQI